MADQGLTCCHPKTLKILFATRASNDNNNNNINNNKNNSNNSIININNNHNNKTNHNQENMKALPKGLLVLHPESLSYLHLKREVQLQPVSVKNLKITGQPGPVVSKCCWLPLGRICAISPCDGQFGLRIYLGGSWGSTLYSDSANAQSRSLGGLNLWKFLLGGIFVDGYLQTCSCGGCCFFWGGGGGRVEWWCFLNFRHDSFWGS